MPHYFFEMKAGSETAAKNEGLDLPDKAAAWSEATEAFGEMISNLDGELKPGSTWQMRVLDNSGNPVFKLAFVTEDYSAK